MSEHRIRAGLANLDGLTKAAKEQVTEEFWKGLSPATNDFFEIVQVDGPDGQKIPAFKGFLVAGIRAFKRQERRIIQATKRGAEFARGIQGQIREGAPANRAPVE